MGASEHAGHLNELEAELVEYDADRDRARLTPVGAKFIAAFVAEVDGFELPSELTVSTLAIMACLAVNAKGDSLHGIVTEDLFNARVPAVEMPELVERIRRGVQTEIEAQWERTRQGHNDE